MAASFVYFRGGIVPGYGPVVREVPGIGFLFMPRKLDPDTRAYYRLRLTRAPVRPLVNLKKFGFDVHLPKIVVYSQAQPHKGIIHGEPGTFFFSEPDWPEVEYEARLAPLWKTYPARVRTSDPGFLATQSEFKH